MNNICGLPGGWPIKLFEIFCIHILTYVKKNDNLIINLNPSVLLGI
jgi:hypothetical protein